MPGGNPSNANIITILIFIIIIDRCCRLFQCSDFTNYWCDKRRGNVLMTTNDIQ